MYLVKNTSRDSVAAAGLGILAGGVESPAADRAPARRTD